MCTATYYFSLYIVLGCGVWGIWYSGLHHNMSNAGTARLGKCGVL